MVMIGPEPIVRWRTVYKVNTLEVHVYPPGDLMVHCLHGGECNCGPWVELTKNADGQDVYMYTHHSLDGREEDEQR
jgi:hypothetical protein